MRSLAKLEEASSACLCFLAGAQSIRLVETGKREEERATITIQLYAMIQVNHSGRSELNLKSWALVSRFKTYRRGWVVVVVVVVVWSQSLSRPVCVVWCSLRPLVDAWLNWHWMDSANLLAFYRKSMRDELSLFHRLAGFIRLHHFSLHRRRWQFCRLLRAVGGRRIAGRQVLDRAQNVDEHLNIHFVSYLSGAGQRNLEYFCFIKWFRQARQRDQIQTLEACNYCGCRCCCYRYHPGARCRTFTKRPVAGCESRM